MFNSLPRPGSKIHVGEFLMLAAFAVPAFATNSNCPSASGTTLDTINAMSNGLSGGFTSGCGLGDQTFGNFAILTNGDLVGPPTTANTNGWANPHDFGANTFTIQNNFGDKGGSGGDGDIVYYSQFGPERALSVLNITVSGIVLAGNGGSLTLTVTSCVNANAPLANNFSSSDCSNATGGFFTGFRLSNTFVFVNNTPNDILNGSFQFSLWPFNQGHQPSTVALDTHFSFSPSVAGIGSFNLIQESFDTPEPGSILLLGTALAGLGLLRFKKK